MHSLSVRIPEYPGFAFLELSIPHEDHGSRTGCPRSLPSLLGYVHICETSEDPQMTDVWSPAVKKLVRCDIRPIDGRQHVSRIREGSGSSPPGPFREGRLQQICSCAVFDDTDRTFRPAILFGSIGYSLFVHDSLQKVECFPSLATEFSPTIGPDALDATVRSSLVPGDPLDRGIVCIGLLFQENRCIVSGVIVGDNKKVAISLTLCVSAGTARSM
jgi:hypothetical protein